MSVTSLPDTPTGDAAPRWFDRAPPRLGEKLPLFSEALTKVAAAWTDGFATLTAAPASFAFTGLSECRVGALATRRGPNAVFALLDAPGWASAVVLQFDRAFVASAVETLFGGEGEEGEAPSGPLSPVEARIAEVIAAQAAGALHAGFADILPSAFRFERILVKPDLSMLGRPNAGAVVAMLRLKALGRSTEVDILVPRAALDVFAEKLAVLPDDEPAVPDPRWASRLQGGVSRAPIALSAVVGLPAMTLGAIAGLRVGQVLALPRDAAVDVALMSGGKRIFRCDLGQAADHLTVRIAGPFKDRRELAAPGDRHGD